MTHLCGLGVILLLSAALNEFPIVEGIYRVLGSDATLRDWEAQLWIRGVSIVAGGLFDKGCKMDKLTNRISLPRSIDIRSGLMGI
jgi:hypothetical protein